MAGTNRDFDPKACNQRVTTSTRDLNRLDIGFLNLFLWNTYGQHTILHRRLDLIHFSILRQPEPPHELAAAAFNPVPPLVLIFLLSVPISADLEDPVIFNFNFYLFFCEAWKVGLEHVSFWGLFPVYAGIN
ncbi:hypothetical protein LINPERPRIM_LOCUS18661 [Linum perenne]